MKYFSEWLLIRESKYNSNFAYWRATQPVQIGQNVPIAAGNRRDKTLEDLLQQARIRVAPEAPSRINAIFLAPDEEGANAWGVKYGIYKVEINGNAWLADAEMYTELFSQFQATRNKESILEMAEEYWTGGPGYLPEIILQGTAKVIELVQQKGIHERLQ